MAKDRKPVGEYREDVIDVAGMMDELTRGCVTKAMQESISYLADEVRANLESHRSGLEHSNRRALADSVRTRVYIDLDEFGNEQVIGEVFIDDSASHIGQFLEYGHEKVLWGIPTGETVPPYPFMRPAFESGGQKAREIFVSTMRKCLKRSKNKLQKFVRTVDYAAKFLRVIGDASAASQVNGMRAIETTATAAAVDTARIESMPEAQTWVPSREREEQTVDAEFWVNR